MSSMYRLHPITETGINDEVSIGYDAICKRIAEKGIIDSILVCEAYPGIPEDEIIKGLSPLSPSLIIRTSALLKPSDELEAFFQDYITDDRVFGFMCHKDIKSCFDAEKLKDAAESVRASCGLVLIAGPGASLLTDKGTLLYFDITRWEIQLRYRKGMPNWLFNNPEEETLRKFKRGYFIEWRMADRHKLSLFSNIEWYISADSDPRMIKASSLRSALKRTAHRPFRMEPYFDPGVWGGQWMKRTFNLPAEKANYAWSFDGVPEENAIILSFGKDTVKIPAINLILTNPLPLLGEHVYGRYGAEFPIRFDILDTMEGGNLSLQVHPLTGYIQHAFGMNYTQDESYYILADSEDSSVYLGLKNGIDRDEMEKDLLSAEKGETSFDAEKYVNKFRAKKHDHFLIPAGTVHCSGNGTVVLEISATPYIFTFKLWDWGRTGLDGKPRPLHIAHGLRNIQWNRDTDWVKENLIDQEEQIHDSSDYGMCRTGLHNLEPIETIRYTIRKEATINTEDSVNMLNLVEGQEAVIESLDGSFPRFEVHHAETFIVPASVKQYRIKAVNGDAVLIAARIRK